MLPLHCFNVVVQFEFEFFEFGFKLNLFEVFCQKKKPFSSLSLSFSFQPKPPARPSPLLFSFRTRPNLPSPAQSRARAGPSAPSPPVSPTGGSRLSGPSSSPRRADSRRVRPPYAPRRSFLLGPHAKARSPPLFKAPAPPWNPWNPIDRKPPPLARANPSRHCYRARSSAPRRRFAAQPRRLRRSEGSPRGEDRPPPRNPSLSRVLGLGKAHRSLSSAGCRCAPCSGRLDPLPSIPSSL